MIDGYTEQDNPKIYTQDNIYCLQIHNSFHKAKNKQKRIAPCMCTFSEEKSKQLKEHVLLTSLQ